MIAHKIAAILLGTTALWLPGLALAQAAPPEPQSQANPPAAPTTAAPPAAATPAAPDSSEIVVTAQKRSENLERVPISLQAFTGATLAQASVFTPGDLQRLDPSFKFTTTAGTFATRFAIRGIGSFSNSAIEPSVATFVNGIYVPRPASIVTSLLDIEQVEVLAGPQGTLFGRNASVGAITFRTATPQHEFSGALKTDYSTGEHTRTEGYVNAPLGDNVAIRFAGLADRLGGYWINDLNGQRFGRIESYQGRVSLKADITPQLVWNVHGDYQKSYGDGVYISKLIPSSLTPVTLAKLVAVTGTPQNLDEYSNHTNQNTDHAYVHDHYVSASSDLAYTTHGGFTLRLLDGYNHWHAPQGDGDSGALSAYILGRDLLYDSKSNSHELQFISPKGFADGNLDFVGGLYHFYEIFELDAASLDGTSFCSALIPLATLPYAATSNPASPYYIPGTTVAQKVATCQAYPNPSSLATFHQSTRSDAAYGQLTLHPSPTLDVTGGIRYTNEHKDAQYIGTVNNPTGAIILTNENTLLSLGTSKVTWRGNVAWRPVTDTMVFATVSTGFKSGGFDNGIATAVRGQARIFQPETTTNYEAGIKTQLFDRKLIFNATAFYMSINNFQERSLIGTASLIRNVGSVRQKGVEADATLRPMPHVRLNGAVSYIDSKITSYANAPLPAYCPTLAQNPSGAASLNCPVDVGGSQNLAGAPLSYNPRWSGVVGATFDGGIGDTGYRWSLNTDLDFTSSQHMGTVIDNTPLLIQAGYALLNGRLTITSPDDRLSFAVYGRNLTNKGYCISMYYQTLDSVVGTRYDSNGDGLNDGTATRCLLGTPRVIGGTVGVKF